MTPGAPGAENASETSEADSIEGSRDGQERATKTEEVEAIRYEMLLPEPAPPKLRALFAHFELERGDVLPVPASLCQDVLILLERGRVELLGKGDRQRRGLVGAGESARVGPRSAEMVGLTTVEGYAVFVRSRDFEIPSSDVNDVLEPPTDRACARQRTEAFVPWSTGGSLVDKPVSPPGGALDIRILIDRANQGASFGALSALDGRAEVTVPEHVHENAVETLLIRSGTGVMKLGDRQVTVAPGEVIYIPQGVPHDFRSNGEQPLGALQVYAPPGPEQRFRAPEPGSDGGLDGSVDGGVDGGVPADGE